MIFAKYLPHMYQGAEHTGRRVLNMGGGGGGSTTSTTYTSNIPEWLRPQTEALLGAGTQEYFNTKAVPGQPARYDSEGRQISPATPATYEITRHLGLIAKTKNPISLRLLSSNKMCLVK
jgi:hypothetical protein